MATDQGKLSNVNGLAIMAALTGQAIPAVGTTSYRPPYVPIAIGALAGHHRGKQFRPTRLTPSHQWAQEQGAEFVETGAWLRAQYFPRSGEKDWLETVTREVRAVRSAVGFCDVSTLGKIEVHGPDAGAFLDRLYINTFSNLPVGRARYGLMLREDGIAFDDGTTSRLADDRYFMTTTTANAVRVFAHMQFCHQVLWPELDVQFASATDEWAQFSLAGPKARDVLAQLVDPPFSISNADFPYMAVAELEVCNGIPARLYRLSFSGELAYEIGVPARYGDALARVLMQAGEPFGIVPYGTEALGVMRIEKGHVAGNELDGRTTADDLGLGPHDVQQEGFYRPRDGGAAGARRSQTAETRRAASTRCGQAALRRRESFAGRRRSHGGERPGHHYLRCFLAQSQSLGWARLHRRRHRADRPNLHDGRFHARQLHRG